MLRWRCVSGAAVGTARPIMRRGKGEGKAESRKLGNAPSSRTQVRSDQIAKIDPIVRRKSAAKRLVLDQCVEIVTANFIEVIKVINDHTTEFDRSVVNRETAPQTLQVEGNGVNVDVLRHPCVHGDVAAKDDHNDGERRGLGG